MDDITALAIGGVVGVVLAVSYKIYTTVSGFVDSTNSIITKVKSTMGLASSNESKKE